MKEHFETVVPYYLFLLDITLIRGKNEVGFVSKFFAASDFCTMVRIKDVSIFKLICVSTIDKSSFPQENWSCGSTQSERA